MRSGVVLKGQVQDRITSFGSASGPDVAVTRAANVTESHSFPHFVVDV